MNGLEHSCRSLNEKSLIENRTKTSGTALRPDVILFSLERYGSRVTEGLRQKGHTVLGVDFDPEMVTHWHTQGWPAYYGDAADPDLPVSLPLNRSQRVVSTIPVASTNITLLHALIAMAIPGKWRWPHFDS